MNSQGGPSANGYGVGLARDITDEIREATNAIIAEAEAMSRAAVRAIGEHGPEAETFLWVRITRLAAAADRAAAAARDRDIPEPQPQP